MSAHDNKEVEIKFVVHDIETLVRSLKDAGFHQKTASTFESNTLYDDSSSTLRQAGSLLRLREYGGHWLITHKSKGTAGKHKSRAEHETEIANGDEMRAILTALGYAPSFRYEKYRAEWSDDEGEVVIDQTPIGNMGEIEGAPDWIDRIAKALGLDERDYITDSYAGLFFQWKQRTGSSAENMTFDECGAQRP